jgi:RNA polymerase sigma-70 factor (ECF subfamily)
MAGPYVDPEQPLVVAAKDGDEAAMAQLWRAVHPSLVRYLRGRIGDGAEDVAAAAWLDAARGLATFEGDDTDFRRWLFTIARRRLVDELRRRGRRRGEWLVDEPAEVAGRAGDPAERGDDLGAALALVRELPADQADAVLLRVVVDLDVTGVATVTGRGARTHAPRSAPVAGIAGATRCNSGRSLSDVSGAMTVHDDDREPLRQPDLDALLDTLRQPARPDELAGEQEAVAAMAAALASSRREGIAPVSITKHSRKLAAVGVAAALIVGGVTAAAASVLTGSSDNRVEIPAQPASTSSSSTSVATTSSTDEATTTSSSVPETATSVDDHGDDTATTVATGPDATTATSVDDHGDHRGRDDTTATSGPDATTVTTDDNGDDNGDDHGVDPATSVPTTGATTATTDDHGGDQGNRGPGSDNSGPGSSGTDNSGPGSGGSDNSGSGSGSGHD